MRGGKMTQSGKMLIIVEACYRGSLSSSLYSACLKFSIIKIFKKLCYLICK